MNFHLPEKQYLYFQYDFLPIENMTNPNPTFYTKAIHYSTLCFNACVFEYFQEQCTFFTLLPKILVLYKLFHKTFQNIINFIHACRAQDKKHKWLLLLFHSFRKLWIWPIYAFEYENEILQLHSSTQYKIVNNASFLQLFYAFWFAVLRKIQFSYKSLYNP